MATFTNLQVSGSLDADGQAARFVVTQENQTRSDEGNLLPQLPLTPAGALATSYEETLMTRMLPNAHDSYVKQAAQDDADSSEAKERWEISSDAQRQASLDELAPLP